MKSKTLTCITAMALLAALAIPIQLAAQDAQANQTKHHHYQLIDLGTLGGPTAYKSVNAPGYQIINNAGVIAFAADTPMQDPFAPNCYVADCFVSHAIRWKNGAVTDLGALPGEGNGSQSGAINARGWIAGQSENGAIDPVTGLPEWRATFWKDDQITDLGTFGGNWSLAATLNDKGQVVGSATNSTPDPFSLLLVPFVVGFGGTQTRAFLWQKDAIQDLGTLGGPDAQALSVNGHGQIAGVSYTNATPNPTTGIPTLHPFLWDKQHGMQDLGTLGGTYADSFALTGDEGSLLVNNQGQVIGLSTLSGDQTYHPFLWDHGKLRDLGTLGGDNGTAVWLTDTGEVLGQADLPGSLSHHAFRWKNGVMKDLGTIGTDPCSRALMANSGGQIVGTTISVCGDLTTHPFLWENGGPMVDLNTLLPAGSGAPLFEADNINEQGEIVASGLPVGCNDRFSCGHVYLLIPCDENHPGVEGCDYSLFDATTAARVSPAPATENPAALPPGNHRPMGMWNRFRFPLGQRSPSSRTDWSTEDVLDLPYLGGHRGLSEADSNGKLDLLACPKRGCGGFVFGCQSCGCNGCCTVGHSPRSCRDTKGICFKCIP